MVADAPHEPAGLRFIEEKPVDWRRLGDLLEPSRRANHWANFGPASQALEARLAAMLDLPPDRAVVATSSGTAALFGLLGVGAARLGRPLRWVGSAFGFLSTRIGALAGAIRFVDCDRTGFLDLSQVDGLAAGSWDGLLVTNVFGARRDLDDYAGYARERGKHVLIDNAMRFPEFGRASTDAPNEFVSFGHTKPWGFGEGGCAVLDRADAPLFRQLIQFGHSAPSGLEPFAANGKISDLAAAAILARLETAGAWIPSYAQQWNRIARLAETAGFVVLHPGATRRAVAFLALLAPGRIPPETLAQGPLPARKYYPPLLDLPNARRLFDRIVCVACHPGMAALDDATITGELAAIAGRSLDPEADAPGACGRSGSGAR